ncbi:MAG: hypothetical protein WCV83_01275 [Candidatus Magasanikbacteria bacterium]
MQIFLVADSHSDSRRDLTAFRPPPYFPKPVESKVLITKSKGVRLGNHSHAHVEGFFLVKGRCRVRTWTENGGVWDHVIMAPTMFMFEPGEEHVLACSAGMILVGYMPVTFEDQKNFPATHL